MTLHRSFVATALFILLVALSLAACGGGEKGAPAAAEPEAPASTEITTALRDRGAGVYKANCVPCHGPMGKGDGPAAALLNPKPRDHSNREYMDTLSDEQVANTIVKGGAPKYPNMPSHPHIKGEDLVGVVAHVRTLSRAGEEVKSVDLAAK